MKTCAISPLRDPFQIATVDGLKSWIQSFPGGPKVHVVADSKIPRVTVYYHKNHVRRFRSLAKFIANGGGLLGVEYEFLQCSHARLKNFDSLATKLEGLSQRFGKGLR